MTFHRGHSGSAKSSGSCGVRQDDDVVPAQSALIVHAVVLLDEVAQRVAGFAGLAHRFDLVLVLPPRSLAPARRRRARPRRP